MSCSSSDIDCKYLSDSRELFAMEDLVKLSVEASDIVESNRGS